MKAFLKRLTLAFRGLSGRERALVSAVVALVVLAGLWFGVALPISDSATGTTQTRLSALAQGPCQTEDATTKWRRTLGPSPLLPFLFPLLFSSS